ncbi:hypothetical protein F2L12_13280 [Salmonella enterica]|uniref:Uncharacterized protein n=1 Tax=Salmonella enterica TaxID=28901 RepID=A0A5Z3BTA9_SALER|nr:hypothetical protein [Salmonella enterica subsp. enterica serovar Enteritidis]ECR6709216.1 hypothetical protein [Salmonella enterica]EDE8091361.1 hypothetical protein [Salmonella enterica subsp. enterica serovar Anecho]EDU7438842.1 hypothetical protein [Salmonella enterica subsp. enterica]EDY6680751.1 hypothetical protein [Salmonella enterica subsp. enterica serovar Typhimurium]EEJ1508819.1 hypothetical protein [Salmonella enterica subsp. enterica serovar Anatum]RCF30749.1 hypothetical pro
MKPFGLFYSREGCTCSLCRGRGYRKNNAYDSAIRTSKHKARQVAKSLCTRCQWRFAYAQSYTS